MSLSDAISRGVQQLSDRGVLTTDVDLTIIGWNDWLAARSGLPVEQVMGRKLLDVFPRLAARQLDSAYRRALEGQVVLLAQRLHEYLLDMPPSEGVDWTARMQQSAQVAPLLQDDRVVGTITVIEDVTDRVEYENDLARRARQQAAIAAIAQMALSGRELTDFMTAAARTVVETLLADRCGVWEFAPERSQAVMLAGVGWQPGALGTAVPASPDGSAPLVPTLVDDQEITSAIGAQVPAGGRPFGWLGVDTTGEHRLKDDDRQFVQTVAHVIGVAVDRKRLETELRRRADELAEADHRKDEFLAMLAHELRNPLAPILNAVQFIGMPGAGPDDVVASHDIIRGQVEQMARLVDDLLDVSRITRGQINLRMEPLRLSDIIAQAVESSRPLVESHQHALEIVLTPEPLEVRGDATRLIQVVTNLLNNAAKYTENGGRLRLSLAREGDEAVLSVGDNGVGISSEMLPRVFDLFAQAARSLDRSQGGLGIGLTLVRRLVELHGGAVSARSGGLGEGSEFVMRLPIVASTRPVAPELKTPLEHGSPGRRVLVVDDNPDAANSLAMLLKIAGHEDLVAYDGQAALDCASRRELDVIFLDICATSAGEVVPHRR